MYAHIDDVYIIHIMCVCKERVILHGRGTPKTLGFSPEQAHASLRQALGTQKLVLSTARARPKRGP